MKKRYILFVLTTFLAATGIILSCTSPFKDMDVSVNSNVYKNVLNLEVVSSTGAPITDAAVTISGPDAGKIYNAEGKKVFTVAHGFLFLGVDPNVTVSPEMPLNINVTISSPGHLIAQMPLKLTGTQKVSLRRLTMVNTATSTPDLTVKSTSVPLGADGTPTAHVTVNIPPAAGQTEATSVTIPAGTQFKDADNKVVTGTNLQVSVIVPVTGSDNLAQVFPGGAGLTQPSVQTSNGASAGALLPGGMSEISLTLDGTPVTNFSKPIDLSITLDPDYINPSTGQTVKAGDKLSIFSFASGNPIWKFEKEATVLSVGGKLTINFSSSHATWFIAGQFIPACTNSLKLKLTADWLKNGITHPVTVKVYSGSASDNDKLLVQRTVTAVNGTELSFDHLPQAAITIQTFDAGGNQLSNTAVANPCTAPLQTIALSASPAASNPKVTLQLYVRCPNQTQPITVLPTFYLYYKEHGSGGAFNLLGVVVNGYISTTLLDPAKRYDFKAIWGNTVKLANDAAIKVDNTATVGDNPSAGEIIGTKAGATNLEILKQKCKEAGF